MITIIKIIERIGDKDSKDIFNIQKILTTIL